MQDETPPQYQLAAAFRQQLGSLTEESTEGDVRTVVHQLLGTQDTPANYYAALDTLSKQSTEKIKKLLLRVLAPILYEMREERGFRFLIHPETGQPFETWEQWLKWHLGLSHTKATNLVNTWLLVLPTLDEQLPGGAEQVIQEIDESKIMLLTPIMMGWKKELDRLTEDAQKRGIDPHTLTLPPKPDLREAVELAKVADWRTMRESMTNPGTQKEYPAIDLRITLRPDGRYQVLSVMTFEQLRYTNQRLRPRMIDEATGKTINWHELFPDD